MAVQMERVLPWVVAVEHNLYNIILPKNKGVSITAVDGDIIYSISG